MQKEKAKQFSADDVVTALLVFLPPEFSNNPEKIHRTINTLQHEERYKDLLDDFEFLDYPRFPYSPLLGRVFNRLQESRLLSSRNPGYVVYETKEESLNAIEDYFLSEGKPLHEYRDKLGEIAERLRRELENDE